MVYSAGKGTTSSSSPGGEYVLPRKTSASTSRDRSTAWAVCGRTGRTAPAVRGVLEDKGYKLRYSGGFVPDINQVLIKKGASSRIPP
jgi:fructose-1,6-bisphosphatase I